MEDKNNSMMVFMSNGKTMSKLLNNKNDAGSGKSDAGYNSNFRLNPKKKESLDSIQNNRLKTENNLLLEKIKVLQKEVASVSEDLKVQKSLKTGMDDLSSYSTDINSNITACPQCGCTRSHHTTDAHKLVDQANKNRIDNRIRLTFDWIENTETTNETHPQQNDILQQQQQLKYNEQQKQYKEPHKQLYKEQQPHVDDLYLKLQEELVACKLREAESCLGFKELQDKVVKLERHWEQFVRDIQNSKQSCEPNWKKHLELKESFLSLKVREVSMTAELNDLKQKLIEMETENNVYKRQEKKLKEAIVRMEEKICQTELDKNELGNSLQETDRRTDALHTQFKEQVIMHKIKEAEQCQAVASLRRSRAELEIENQQLLASLKLNNSASNSINHQTHSNKKNNFSLTKTSSGHHNKPPCIKYNPEKTCPTVEDTSEMAGRKDDVKELLSKCDMSDIMTESFYADSIYLQSNLEALTSYDSLVSSDSNHTLNDDPDNSETDSLN